MSQDGLNLFVGIGTLGKDPEMRYTAEGAAVVSFSMACNRTWYDKATQEKRENVEWVNLTAWNRLAETIGKYLTKGSRINVQGRLETRSWDDKETGAKHYKTSVVVEKMLMLGGGTRAYDGPAEIEADDTPATRPPGGWGGAPAARRTAAPATPPAQGSLPGRPRYVSPPVTDEDDIPF